MHFDLFYCELDSGLHFITVPDKQTCGYHVSAEDP